ncbi:hypothetical protein [Bilophila wadsworthia]|uniref:hypothetical protein n=2 Tax=Bilophila wadsworthia TaxID=35833 RepID=UPI003AB20045
MQQEDKACFVQGGRELAKAAYKTGFDDGFEAAVYSLMTISDGLKERDGAGLPSEIIVALGKCKAKAFECFGRDRFEVQHMPTVGSEQ